MNLKKFLVAGMAVLALAACKKDDIESPEVNEYGTTHMSFTLDLSGQLRAHDDGEQYNPTTNKTWAGNDYISNVNAYVISESTNTVQQIMFDGKNEITHKDAGKYQSDAWQTTPGPKTVYVVVNTPPAIADALNKADANAFKQEFDKLVAMTDDNGVLQTMAKLDNEGKDVIIMSGDPTSSVIEDGVSKEAAKTHPKNNVKLSVQRGVARVVTTVKAGTTVTADGETKVVESVQVKDGDEVIGTLSNMTWAPAQYEKESYISQQISEDGFVKSPGFEFIPKTEAEYYTTEGGEAATYYHYNLLKNSNRKQIKALTGNFHTAQTGTDAFGVGVKDMVFITETTHQDNESDTGNDDLLNYRKGNTPYVMIKAQFTPDASVLAAGEATYVLGDDLYFGTVDGKFYTNEANAKAANNVDGVKEDGVITYPEGYMYYFAWVNPNTNNPETWYNGPVFRNNIYHINILGFTGKGYSGNPFNPDPDPDNPDPDPDDPTPTPDEPLKDKKTHMAVEITVLKWNVHSYDITF